MIASVSAVIPKPDENVRQSRDTSRTSSAFVTDQ